MESINVRILNEYEYKGQEQKIFPGCTDDEKKNITHLKVSDVAILENGTALGKETVMLMGECDGNVVILETTGQLFTMMNQALQGAMQRFKQG